MVRITGEDDDDVKDDDIEDDGDAVRTTGKDNNDRKDDDSEDNGEDGKDDNNDGGNDDRGGDGGGGGEIGGEVGGVARPVAMAWLVAVFFTVGCLALTYHRNCTDMFGNKFILVKILFVYIPGLFYVYSGIKSGINYQF
jgi:hypothetical protein